MASYPSLKRATGQNFRARQTCTIEGRIETNEILVRLIKNILQECGLYNRSVEGSRNNPIKNQQVIFINTIMSIHQLYFQTYMRPNSLSIEDKLQNMNRCFNSIFVEMGNYIISKLSDRHENMSNIDEGVGEGMTGEFLSLRSRPNRTNKGIKFRTYSNPTQIAKLFLEFLIFKLLYINQRENQVDIMRRLRYLPIPSIDSFTRYSNGRYGIQMNKVGDTTLSKYFSTTFNSLSSENKLLKLKSILRKIADILQIFQDNILFVHCDFAPNNIMIQDEDPSVIGSEQIYIIDLGKALIAPEFNVITIRNLTLDSNSPESFRDSLLSIDLSTLIFSIINVYSRHLDENCVSYLFDIMFGRQHIFNIFSNLTSGKLVITELNKTILNSSIIYALMYFSLTIDGEIRASRNNSWEFVHQNPKDKLYTTEEAKNILIRRDTNPPTTSYFFNFIHEVYVNKLRGTKSNRMKAYDFPELSIFKNSFWKQNFYILLNEWFKMINAGIPSRIYLFSMPMFYNIFTPFGLKARMDIIENPPVVVPAQPIVRVNNSAGAPQIGKRKSMNAGGKRKKSTKTKKTTKKKKITKKSTK